LTLLPGASSFYSLQGSLPSVRTYFSGVLAFMNDSSRRRGEARTGARAETARVFYDADGICWHVYEQPSSEYDRRRGVSLIFASEAAIRRVRTYPADWRTLSDEDLAALSWKA
jgi:hypothetical protein